MKGSSLGNGYMVNVLISNIQFKRSLIGV